MRAWLAALFASRRPTGPPPIPAHLLLDRAGRPLRGAARAARLRRLERERAPLAAAPAPAPRLRPPPLPALTTRSLRLIALTTVLTFVLATAIGIGGFVSQRGTVALGASTTLTVIAGEVSVSASDGAPFEPASDGAVLRAGMTVRTSADAYAVLTYFEGSTVSLDPGTTLVIAALEANPDGTTIVSVRQVIGRTWHAVERLAVPGSRYDVRTPTAVATVRGTKFEVDVAPDPSGEIASTVATTEGTVGTSKPPTLDEPRPAEVLVRPGFQVTVRTTAPIEPPAPQPEPERVVSVTVDAPSGIVLDPFGRANGIRDGKVIAQTPGTTVATVDGKLVVTFSKVASGTLATVVDRGASGRDVGVVTTVRDRGKGDRSVESVAVPAPATSGPTPRASVAAVELTEGGVEVAQVSEEEGRAIAADVNVADVPEVGRETGRAFVPEVGLPALPDPATGRRHGSAANGSGFVPGVALPTIPGGQSEPATAAGRPAAETERPSPSPSPRGQGPAGTRGPSDTSTPPPPRAPTPVPLTPPPARTAAAETQRPTQRPATATPAPTETPHGRAPTPEPSASGSPEPKGLVPKVSLPTLPFGSAPPGNGNGRP